MLSHIHLVLVRAYFLGNFPRTFRPKVSKNSSEGIFLYFKYETVSDFFFFLSDLHIPAGKEIVKSRD